MRNEREIIRKIVEIVNGGNVVSFDEDWGGNTLTIHVGDKHTHVGIPDGDLNTLVNQMHDVLVKGRGLSWEG